jgi:hypothetical protein
VPATIGAKAPLGTTQKLGQGEGRKIIDRRKTAADAQI